MEFLAAAASILGALLAISISLLELIRKRRQARKLSSKKAYVIFVDLPGYSGPAPEDIRKDAKFVANSVKLTLNDMDSFFSRKPYVKYTGDGALMVFYSEEPALAWKIVKRIFSRFSDATLPVRFGLSTGAIEFIYDPAGNRSVLGAAVSNAARLVAAASPGEVLIAEDFAESLPLKASSDYAKKQITSKRDEQINAWAVSLSD